MPKQAFKVFSEARLGRAQDLVLSNYKKRFGLTQQEAGQLHMFFSPHRIPKRLTLTEARIAIMLYPLREQERRNRLGRLLQGGSIVASLPPKLRQSNMTRTSFTAGVMELLARLAAT